MIDQLRAAIMAEIERQGLTQRHVAKECGISHIHLWYFLHGYKDRGMNLNQLAVLLKFLRMELRVVRTRQKKRRAAEAGKGAG